MDYKSEEVDHILNTTNKSLYKTQNNNCDSSSYDSCDEFSKKRKLDDFSKLIEDQISAYREWFNSTIVESRKADELTNYFIPNDFKPVISPNHQYSELSQDYVNHFQILPNIQSNIQTIQYGYHTAQQHKRVSNNDKKNKMQTMGYWGPLLRYGTYGVYKIHRKLSSTFEFNRCSETQLLKLDANEKSRTILRVPLNLPLHIRLPRQAMICTLQAKAKLRLHDLRKVEQDPVLHMNINYSHHLDLITKQCGTCPKYLYTKVKNLPCTERGFFTFLHRDDGSAKKFLSLDGSILNEIKSTNHFYACELLIGDIIISQGFAFWKRRSREICSKNAFRVLEKPCHMVSSVRYWYGTDYLTACTTTDPTIVPILPPFLTDPTEPLYKKDEKINESDPEENFDILNPKPLNDFWLYVPTLKQGDNIKSIDPQTILYQSAEFSQMNLSFEVETCWDESFACTIMIDKSPAVRVEGLGSLEQACQASALVLVDKLVDTQPIVVLQEMYHQQYLNLGTNSSDNSFLVRSLMWGRQNLNNPLDFKELSYRIANDNLILDKTIEMISSANKITSLENFEILLIMYAQSSLVNPIRLLKEYLLDELWPNVAEKVRKCGLIFLNERERVQEDGDEESKLIFENREDKPSTNSLIISKQVPHIQLKAMLMKEKYFGVFSLLSQGKLDIEYLSNLEKFICYNNISNETPSLSPGSDDSCHSCNSTSVECEEPLGFLLLPKKIIYDDILKDAPKDFIPGLDL